ncbi:hypothetical protein ACFCW4_20790 [Streptomyces virginiae]
MWELLDAAAADPWSAGRLSVGYFANRVLRQLSVLDIVRLGD